MHILKLGKYALNKHERLVEKSKTRVQRTEKARVEAFWFRLNEPLFKFLS